MTINYTLSHYPNPDDKADPGNAVATSNTLGGIITALAIHFRDLDDGPALYHIHDRHHKIIHSIPIDCDAHNNLQVIPHVDTPF